MSLADLRRDYSAGKLERSGMDPNPIVQFQKWFDEARQGSGGRFRRFGIHLYKAFRALLGDSPVEPNAMVVATVDGQGQPSARTVLLKGISDKGFTFFTNYKSRKGQELEGNPNAALVFYWPALERQVCVAGSVTRLSREESEAYFRSRPRGSQIGAWASDQSSIIASRKDLERAEQEVEAQYAGKPVPLPPHWGGFVLSPDRIEFWQGRPSRLHDRFRFIREAGNSWKLDRLSP